MKKLIVGSMIAIAGIGQAHAWGEKEQAALAGLVAGAVAMNAYQNRVQTYPNGQPPVIVGQVPAPVIYGQAQRHYCYSKPVLFDPYTGRPTHYATECRYY